MITTTQMKAPATNFVRVFFIYQDFHLRVDDNSPVHYDADVRQVDSQGNKWMMTFRVFALDRKGRLIIFEHKWPHSYIQTIQRQTVLRELTLKFADPLNAIPGRIEVR